MHHTLKAFALTGLLVLIQCISASAQSKSWRQYTTQDGLPSNEVYDMLQDRDGYIWFATDQGICRFNGYEFTQPVDTSAGRGSGAFIPTLDYKGRIWFERLGPSLWFIENDTVVQWRYNHLLSGYRDIVIDQLGIAIDGTVWIALNDTGFLVVDANGKTTLLRESENRNFTFKHVNGKVIFVSQRERNTSPKIPDSPTSITDLLSLDDDQTTLIAGLPYQNLPTSFIRGIWPLRNGGFIHDYGGSVLFIRDNQIQWQIKTPLYAEKMIQTPEEQLLFASHYANNSGLFLFTSPDHLRRGDGQNLLPGQFVTDVLCDREGGWWASTKNAGLFYCENPDLAIFGTATAFISNDIVRLSHDGNQIVYAGLRPSAVYAIDRNSAMITDLRVPQDISEIFALHYDFSRARLWCSPMLHSLNEELQWQIETFSDTSDGIKRGVPGKKIVIDPSERFLYANTHSGFVKFDPDVHIGELLGESDNTFDRTFSIALDAHGTIWVVTNDGLKQWTDNQYKPPPFSHPALRYQPRDLEILPDGSMAIGLRADGLLLKDPQDRFTHLTVKDGLTSNYITKLAVSSEGEVLVCTNAGLNRIYQKNDRWYIQSITIKQGLPSNHINDATSLAGEIWVATDNGLAHFEKIPPSYPMPKPVIEKITINNTLAIDTTTTRFRYHQNNITLRFYALHYRSNSDILYRYRLQDADTTFTQTNSREVNFAQLPPGKYTFEVEAQNTDSQWSKAEKWSFVIRPAWWQTWWFRAAIILLLLAGLWYFYHRRLHETRKAYAIQNKIRDLEAAALRAQMNPHFIFNCLVSIQQFISENDADSASAYLAKFAKLVRLALHSAVDGRHTLREEVEMLENYLALEQLRFKNRFSYEIHISPDLNTDEISIPPILIQPFVENAIVHGIKNKTADGRIEIVFSKTENTLIVTVTDNGPGLTDPHQLTTETGHKSVGTTLTQRRLDILASHTNDNVLCHENLTDDQGVVIGSKVRVEIPVE